MSADETWTTTYTGNASDSLQLTDLGFQPSMIMIKTADTSACSVTVPNGGNMMPPGIALTSNSINTWTRHDLNTHCINISGTAKISGDAEIDGDLIVKGENITELLEDIKDRLVILRPNKELESRWDQLRELRQQYMEMERDILEKEEILRILKE